MRKMSPDNGFTLGGKLYVAKRGRCEKCAFFHMDLAAGDLRCTAPRGAPSCVSLERSDGRDVIFVPAGTRRKKQAIRP